MVSELLLAKISQLCHEIIFQSWEKPPSKHIAWTLKWGMGYLAQKPNVYLKQQIAGWPWLAVKLSSAQLSVIKFNRSFFFHTAAEGTDQIVVSTRFWQDVETHCGIT